MSIRAIEKRGSRNGTSATDKSSTADLVWQVDGSHDPHECREYLLDEKVPTLWDGLLFRSISWDHLGDDAFEFTARYVHPEREQEEQLDTGDYTFSFDTTGGTVHITTSKATTKYAKAGEVAPDYKGLIGVSENDVKGVDIVIPSLKFTIRQRQPMAVITIPYVKMLSQLTGGINNDAWFGFDEGEVMFLGATGSQGIESDPEITYSFAVSVNDSDLTVGDITGISKEGHEYLWVLYESIEDSTANMTVKQPKAAYVEQVGEKRDFSLLGVG